MGEPMNAWRGSWAALMALPLLGGCAYVTAVPAPPGSEVQGIRIPEAKPILIVNDQEVKIEMIPNYNRAYALQFGAFLAKHKLEIEFERGFIKTMKSDQDSTAIIDLLKSIVEKIPENFAFSGPGMNSGASGRFGIYEFVFDEQGNLLYLRPLLHEKDLMRLPKVATAGSSAAGTQVPQPTPTNAKTKDESGTIGTVSGPKSK